MSSPIFSSYTYVFNTAGGGTVCTLAMDGIAHLPSDHSATTSVPAITAPPTTPPSEPPTTTPSEPGRQATAILAPSTRLHQPHVPLRRRMPRARSERKLENRGPQRHPPHVGPAHLARPEPHEAGAADVCCQAANLTARLRPPPPHNILRDQLSDALVIRLFGQERRLD